MKILMVSIFAPHFFNWTAQIKDSGHEVYWMDVFDSNTYVEKIGFAEQIIGWRYKLDYPGRYFLKENYPKVTNIINKWNERIFEKEFEKQLEKIKPDVVHSFVMYLSVARIKNVMQKHSSIKWVYSSWGSDLYYYQHIQAEREIMRNAFPNINYMFADCKRDHEIARSYGFRGEFLGVFPGGGGLDFEDINKYILPLEERNLIVIKGYQGLHGKCIEVLKALVYLKEFFNSYQIIVFGAGEEVIDFIQNSEIAEWKNITVNKTIGREEVLKLMGAAKIYIGNSSSDGMPNTLLEAICLGAFPVQSNPGGATSEIVTDNLNGLLIEEPENIQYIKNLLVTLFVEEIDFEKSFNYNLNQIKPSLEKYHVQSKVIEKYNWIENQINSQV